jgi:integration host factor subunit alpha
MIITKERIINAVFEQAELPRKAAREVVEKLLTILKETLADEKDVLVSGFGKFQVRRKRARRGATPRPRSRWN